MSDAVARAAADLAALAGDRLCHVTAAENVDTILARGLLSAHALCISATIDPAAIVLRRDRLRAGDACLGHQRPILDGLAAANRVIEGHDARSWAAALDRRVFFWPGRGNARFGAALERGGATAVLHFDTRALARACADRLDLSPLNSGNFTQGGAHARRGDWLYVPLSAGAEAFRTNRQRRGLVKGRDTLREVSLRGSLDAGTLKAALVAVDRA